MFVSALQHGDMTEPAQLWNWFAPDICSDLPHRIEQQTDNVPVDLENAHWDFGLHLIAQDLARYGRTLNDFNMPGPVLSWEAHAMNPLIAAERAYDQDEQAATLAEQLPQLNTGQRSAFDTIVQAVDTNLEQAHFFVQGPAGTGKTFLWTALCCQYRSQGKVVLCVASSGIASLLLPGGLTAHS